MATPVVVVASGGLPIVVATNGFGTPMTIATNGYGTPVTIATNGYGIPVVGVTTGGAIPAVTATPVVSGTPTVPNVLNCTTGTWTNSPTGYAYQWYRTT